MPALFLGLTVRFLCQPSKAVFTLNLDTNTISYAERRSCLQICCCLKKDIAFQINLSSIVHINVRSYCNKGSIHIHTAEGLTIKTPAVFNFADAHTMSTQIYTRRTQLQAATSARAVPAANVPLQVMYITPTPVTVTSAAVPPPLLQSAPVPPPGTAYAQIATQSGTQPAVLHQPYGSLSSTPPQGYAPVGSVTMPPLPPEIPDSL